MGWGEVGANGECGLPSGEKGCDYSRSSNSCHTLSVRNLKRKRESEGEAMRNPPPSPASPALHAVSPSLSNQVSLQGLGGGKASDWLSGRDRRFKCSSQTVGERWGRRDVTRCSLTLSVKGDAVNELMSVWPL